MDSLRKHQIFLGILTFVCLLTIIGGFRIVGTPESNKESTFDERRIQNIDAIVSFVSNYYRAESKLPENLQVLDNKYGSDQNHFISDPETDKLYEYTILGPLKYEICANFVTQSKKMYSDVYLEEDVRAEFEAHTTGRNCGEFTVKDDNVIVNPTQNAAVQGTFSDLRASLSMEEARFSFSYSEDAEDFSIDVSTDPYFASNVFFDFARGKSPIVTKTFTYYDYTCMTPLYWRVTAKNSTQFVYSSTQLSTVSCKVPVTGGGDMTETNQRVK